MSWFLENMVPRSYTDLTVPNRADGTALTACRYEGDYDQYVAWLADYLHTARPPDFPSRRNRNLGSMQCHGPRIKLCSSVRTLPAMPSGNWMKSTTGSKPVQGVLPRLRQKFEKLHDGAHPLRCGIEVQGAAPRPLRGLLSPLSAGKSSAGHFPVGR